jgi:hypothetical protein
MIITLNVWRAAMIVKAQWYDRKRKKLIETLVVTVYCPNDHKASYEFM